MLWGFYRRCVRRAWEGSIDGANAASNIFGAAVILFGAWLLGRDRVTMPETLFDTVVLGLACLGVSWLIIFLVRLFFVAPNALYKDLKDEKDRIAAELVAERERIHPRLHGIIEQTITGAVKGYEREGTVTHINLRVTNTGAPSAIVTWQVQLTVDGVSYPCEKEQITDGTTVALGDAVLSLSASDAIYDKAVQPIPTGGLIRGWFRCRARIPSQELDSAGHMIWTLSFQDVEGKTITATHEIRPLGPACRHGNRFSR